MRGGKREGAGRKPGSPNKELKPDARREIVRVRLSAEEKATIAYCLKATGKTESAFIRDAIAAEIGRVQLAFALCMGITGKEGKNETDNS